MQPRAARWLRAATLIAAVSLATPRLASSQEDTVIRWYDIRALEAASLEDPEGVDLRLPLASSFLDQLEPDGWDVRVESGFDFDDYGWPQLLLDGLGEDWPDDRMYADPRAGFLRVEGTAATQRAVAAILGELADQFLNTIDIELFVVRPAAVPADAPAVLSPAQVDAIVAAGEVLDYSRAAARTGHRVRIGQESLRSALIDYDVEVASKSRVPDPTVTAIPFGATLGAVAQMRLDGDVFLRVWGRRGVISGEPRRFPLPHFDGVSIEMPRMSSTLAVASANLPNGGGLLLRQDGNADGVWLVRVRASSTSTSGSNGTSPFVPLGELTARPCVKAPIWLPRTSPSGGWDDDMEGLLEQLGDAVEEPLYSPDDLLDMFRDERDDLDLGGSLILLGHTLYVRGSEALTAHCRQRVRELRDALSGSTIELDVRYGMLKRSAAGEVASKSPEELARVLNSRALGACRPGDTLLLVGGRERFYVKDHDVEIAEASAIVDPIIGNLFDGISLWCRPVGGSTGDHLSAWIDVAVQENGPDMGVADVPVWEPRNPEQGEPSTTPHGTFHAKTHVELPATARGGARTMLRARDGQWSLVCAESMTGSDDRMLVVVARLTRR